MEQLSDEEKTLITEYISQLSDVEKKVLIIAQEHLESSFNITKSIGYIKWLSNYKTNI
tara:strand:+ start:1070 stop:1243 length:174 start_codon:yes stop_codon:yes gene_type:complete